MNIELSIIIPVYNEPDIINETISHLNGLSFSRKPEIIIVDGHSSQNTLQVVKGRHVKKIPSAKGRGIQMNTGAKAASGNIFLFLHADTYLDENAPEAIIKILQDKNTVAGAFDLAIRSPKAIFRLTEKYVYIRSRLTHIPYGDQGIFIKREFFEMLGGYPDMPLMEDVELMRRVKKAGGKIAIIDTKISPPPRRWEKEGFAFCTLRNLTLISLYLLGVPAEKLYKYYP